MEELVFATYIRELKDAWKGTVTTEDLINLLFGQIVIPCNVKSQKGESYYVSKESASRLLNRKENVSPKIWKHADDADIVKSTKDYFAKYVVCKLMATKQAVLMGILVEIIKNDPNINLIEQQILLQNADKERIAEFLGDLFLYTIKRKNKILDTTDVQKQDEENLQPSDKEALKKMPLGVISTPEEVTADERTYVDALLKAYGQTLGIPDLKETELESYPQMKRDLSRQRRCYFAAEAVRRGIRDVYIEDDQDHFQVLKDEVFDGVVDVFEENHKSGMDRLSKVMAQAAVIHTDRSLLVRETVWIGVSQKKGVCHFLIDDGSLTEWVRDDDEQFV